MSRRRGRPEEDLIPERSARARLAQNMRQLRSAAGDTVNEAARRFGEDPSTISRVERANAYPDPRLVEQYDRAYGGDGLLMGLLEWVMRERYYKGFVPAAPHSVAIRADNGDRSELESETPEDGRRFAPGESFTKTWVLRNAGTVPWRDRHLARDTPPTVVGPIGPPTTPVPDCDPGEVVSVEVDLRAGSLPGSAIQYWSMRYAGGELCFPHRTVQGVWVNIQVWEPAE